MHRQSPEGKNSKQSENRRFRENNPDFFRNYRRSNLERVRAIERQSKRRRRSAHPIDVHKVRSLRKISCHRPGCYLLFLVLEALGNFRRYCGDACRKTMRRFLALLAQLRYRKTPSGNYKRKLSRD